MKNPLKAPQALFSPVGSLIDKARILELNFKTRAGDEPGNFQAAGNETTIDYLESFGFSRAIIERFFQPFFGGVFLETELHTRADFFKFLYAMFAAGDAALPRGGMQKIPEQIAQSLDPRQIRLNAKVEKIEGQTIRLETGETLAAEKIVLATDELTAARLLGLETAAQFNGTACFYFAGDAPLAFEDEPYLMINANQNEKINHLLNVSAAVPSYAPAGKTLLSVNVVGEKTVDEKEIEKELKKWFGEKINWRHLKTYRIKHALPQFLPTSAPSPELKINEFLYRCGDYAAYPSLNGAMKTGRLVAEMLKT